MRTGQANLALVVILLAVMTPALRSVAFNLNSSQTVEMFASGPREKVITRSCRFNDSGSPAHSSAHRAISEGML